MKCRIFPSFKRIPDFEKKPTISIIQRTSFGIEQYPEALLEIMPRGYGLDQAVLENAVAIGNSAGTVKERIPGGMYCSRKQSI